MRGLLVLALVASLATIAPSAANAGGSTALTVTYWPKGRDAEGRRSWTLRCQPARGTLPRPAVACRRLATTGTRLFAPVPPATVCTEIYGGPQVARVVGTVRGRRVAASFRLVNGCEIDRWKRLSPWLLPKVGTTG